MRSRGPALTATLREAARSLYGRQVAHAARPHRHHDRHRLGDRHDLDRRDRDRRGREIASRRLGTDILTIEKAGTPAQGRDAAIGLETALALGDALPTIALAAPQIEAQGSFAYGGKSVGQGLTHGVSAAFAPVNRLRRGRRALRVGHGRGPLFRGGGGRGRGRHATPRRRLGRGRGAGGRRTAVHGRGCAGGRARDPRASLPGVREQIGVPADHHRSTYRPGRGDCADHRPRGPRHPLFGGGPGHSGLLRRAHAGARGRGQERRAVDRADGIAARADDAAARRRRQHQPHRGRHRGDEHHADLGGRAAPRDRYPPRARRDPWRHPGPVS